MKTARLGPKFWIVAMAAVWVCGAGATDARASSITFAFTGTILYSYDYGTDFTPGTQVSGFYTFESTTAPFNANATSAYYDPLTAVSVTVGAYTYQSLASGFGNYIQVVNNGSGVVDAYGVDWTITGGAALPSGNKLVHFTLQLTDVGAPPDLLTSTALPLVPPSFALSQGDRYISLMTDGPAGRQQYIAALTSLTLQPTTTAPEPASIALLGLGLVGVAAMARRKRKR